MIITVGDIKRYLNIDRVDEDGRIFEAVKAADKEIKRYCGRDFEYAEYIEYFDGNNAKSICVKNAPIDTSQTINIYDDTDREFTSDDLIDSDDYTIDSTSGCIDFDFELGDGKRNVKVDYYGGYKDEDMPYDIKEAVKMLGAYYYLRANGSNLTMEATADWEKYREKAFEIADRYRRQLI